MKIEKKQSEGELYAQGVAVALLPAQWERLYESISRKQEQVGSQCHELKPEGELYGRLLRGIDVSDEAAFYKTVKAALDSLRQAAERIYLESKAEAADLLRVLGGDALARLAEYAFDANSCRVVDFEADPRVMPISRLVMPQIISGMVADPVDNLGRLCKGLFSGLFSGRKAREKEAESLLKEMFKYALDKVVTAITEGCTRLKQLLDIVKEGC